MSPQAAFHEEEFGGRVNLRTWRKVFRHALKYKWSVIALACCSVTLATLDCVFPLMTGWVVDVAAKTATEVQAHAASAEGAVQNGKAGLLRLAAIYGGMVLLFATLVRLFIGFAGKISTHVSHDIRRTLFAHLQDLSFSYFDRRPAGWLLARLTGDCDRLSRVIAWGMLDLIWSPCILIGLCAALVWLRWQVGLVVVCGMPPLFVLGFYFQQKMLKSSRRMRKVNSELTASYNEALMGVRTTKTLARETESLGEFGVKSREMYEASVTNALQGALYLPLIFSMGTVATGVVLWLAGADRVAGTIRIGEMVAIMVCAGQIVYPIYEFARALTDVQAAQAAAERVVSVLETVPEVRDSDEVRALVQDHSAGEARKGQAPDGHNDHIGQIEFRNVSFSYSGGPAILTDFNLTVRAGQSIAMVGPTGGGKTTIISLLCRFYEPTAGEILIDGVDYRKRSLAWWQSKLGVVLQTPHLFSGTVRENIRFGRLAASEAELFEAARQVGAHEFIMGMEKGYDSEVGQAGNRLSTGQRQLVSFARAVLADPAILIMDEATSSIDAQTEAVIQAGMKNLLVGRTSFIIAHRLSTNRGADTILVIDGGRIVEQGTHRQLLAGAGHYFNLYTQQFQREEEDRILAKEDEGVAAKEESPA
jgi:ATP-binding cassette subfamily B protein